MFKLKWMGKFGLFSLVLSLNLPLFPYDQVQVEKIISLTEAKISPAVFRMDPQGNFWVLNEKSKSIQTISTAGVSGVPLKLGLKNPTDFSFLRDGSMVIADSVIQQVLIIKPASDDQENKILDWSNPQILGRILVKNPTAVAASLDDCIAVADGKENFIHLYSLDGVHLYDLFPPQKNSFKKIGSMAFARDGVLWALDDEKGVLHRFSPSRKWLGETELKGNPRFLALDDYGYGYVTLSTGKWFEISPDGKISGKFGTKGKKSGQLSGPSGIVAPGTSPIWVAEKGNKRIQSFRVLNKDKRKTLGPQPVVRTQIRKITSWGVKCDLAVAKSTDRILLYRGKNINFEWVDANGKTVSSFGKKGKKDKSFIEPMDMTFDQQGNLWISDAGDHKIKKVSETGEIVSEIGKKGKEEGGLVSPSFIRIRDDSSVVIVDKGNSRVQVLSPENLFLFSIGSLGKGPGQFQTVSGMGVNPKFIALIDNKRKALIFYDSNGKFVSEVANQEKQPPVWDDMVSLKTDRQGYFFVNDRGAKRIRVFSPDGTFLADLSIPCDDIALGPNGFILLKSLEGLSTYSVDFVPKALENLKAEDNAGVIRVSWDSCLSCKSFLVYKSSPTVDFKVLATTNTASIYDENVRPGVEYTYGVRGVNGMGYAGNWTESAPVIPSKRKDVSRLSLAAVQFSPVFTAAFKYYVDHPIGSIEIQNNSDEDQRNIKISLSLKKYTDFATEKSIDLLLSGQKQTIPVAMTFNDSVLELTENTPVQVDIKLTYFEDNEEKVITKNAPLTLYSRNAIVWEDKARVSSFITPRDTPIMEFSRAGIRAFLPNLKGSTVGKPLAKAALFYEALNALKISYAPDPTTPYAEVSGNPETIDYVQFPRETLRRRTGDCDDTTALLASLLESIGVNVALVDAPGHIFLMANLEETDPQNIGLPAERFVEYKGTLWVPIETTRFGTNFIDAWKTARNQIKLSQDSGKIEFIPIVEASKKYPPVTIVEKEAEPVAFPESEAKAGFLDVMSKLQNEKYQNELAAINELIKNNPNDKSLLLRLGMIHVEGKQVDEGKKIFSTLLQDPEPEIQASAKNNLANLAFLAGDFKAADQYYSEAATLSPKDGGIFINRARTTWKLGQADEAKKYLAEAKKLLPDWKEFVTDLPPELLPK